MRLYDRIKTKVLLPEMPVIVADEIARQYDDLPIEGRENEPFPADWYGKVAPPFNEFWIEARTFDTRRIHSNDVLTMERGVHAKVIDNEISRKYMPNARWVLVLIGFQWISIAGEFTFGGVNYIGVGQDGGLLLTAEGGIGVVHYDDFYTKQALESGFARNRILPAGLLETCTTFFLKAINAMHQRVEVAEITPTRQMNRLSERKHGVKLSKYYFLKVKPYEPKVFEDFKNIGKPDKKDSRREHEVRGHFRYYHPDKPLFGRAGLTGMIWVPDHTRGNHELGIVEKGYEVKNA